MEHDQRVCGCCGEGVDESAAPDRAAPAPAPQDVARLKDVLTASKADRDRILNDASTEDAAPAPAPAPASPISLEVRLSDWSRAPRQVARLEDVLTVLPEPKSETGREANPARASAPSYVAAHRLRSAFLFEQTAAFEAQVEEIAEGIHTPLAPSQHAEPDESHDYGQTRKHDDSSEAVTQPAAGQPWQNHSLLALCLLALIAVLVLLSGRRPRRCGDVSAS